MPAAQDENRPYQVFSVPADAVPARPMSSRGRFTLPSICAPTDMHRNSSVVDIVRHIEAIDKRRNITLQLDVTH